VKKKLVVLVVLALLLAVIPTMVVCAKTIVVRVRADMEWVETGFYVEAGKSYKISSHGIAWTGSPSLYPDSKSGPAGQTWGGGCSLNDPALPCNLDGAPYGALIGNVDGISFLIGDADSFVAPASGVLFLGVNDDLIYHADNQAGFTVQFK